MNCEGSSRTDDFATGLGDCHVETCIEGWTVSSDGYACLSTQGGKGTCAPTRRASTHVLQALWWTEVAAYVRQAWTALPTAVAAL